MSDLSHFDESGASRMVDVGGKPESERMARASGRIEMEHETWQRVKQRDFRKGDVLEVARLAGIMASKRTADLIPLCHPLPLTAVKLDFRLDTPGTVEIECQVKTRGQTGVEMEALTATSVAALTIYDMCKAIDRSMQIVWIRLEEKEGGASGHFQRCD